MPRLTVEISQSLLRALEARRGRTGESVAHIVMTALADALEVDHATLFQVSMANALTQGVYQGAVTIETLKQHGDFGLGTFDGLDGEMVALDGRFYRVDATGAATEAPDDALVPFSVVTDFPAHVPFTLDRVTCMADLTSQLDRGRETQNLFYAVRIDGRFTRIKARAICKTASGVSLVEAAERQSEFTFTDVAATLVGFWTPAYARTINVPGWHLHVITGDRRRGGHVLNVSGSALQAQLAELADVRIAIPETAEFLRADLSQDVSQQLAMAESGREPPAVTHGAS